MTTIYLMANNSIAIELPNQTDNQIKNPKTFAAQQTILSKK